MALSQLLLPRAQQHHPQGFRPSLRPRICQRVYQAALSLLSTSAVVGLAAELIKPVAAVRRSQVLLTSFHPCKSPLVALTP